MICDVLWILLLFYIYLRFHIIQYKKRAKAGIMRDFAVLHNERLAFLTILRLIGIFVCYLRGFSVFPLLCGRLVEGHVFFFFGFLEVFHFPFAA